MVSEKIKISCKGMSVEAEGSQEYINNIFDKCLKVCKDAGNKIENSPNEEFSPFNLPFDTPSFDTSLEEVPITTLGRNETMGIVGPYVIKGEHNNIVVNTSIDDFTRDAINIRENDTSLKFDKNGKIIDRTTKTDAHRDGIQLIPKNNWFAGEVLSDVTIYKASIESQKAKLQTILGTDGRFRDIKIHDCILNTASEHGITFNGLLSGEIANNVCKGNARITLNPTRLAGGKGNIWIASELGKSDMYHPIEGLDTNKAKSVIDYRNIFNDGPDNLRDDFLNRYIKKRSGMVIKNFDFDTLYTIMTVLNMDINNWESIVEVIDTVVEFNNETEIIYDSRKLKS